MKTEAEIRDKLAELRQRRKRAKARYIIDYLTTMEMALEWALGEDGDDL